MQILCEGLSRNKTLKTFYFEKQGRDWHSNCDNQTDITQVPIYKSVLKHQQLVCLTLQAICV
jgi:hypothetical protein